MRKFLRNINKASFQAVLVLIVSAGVYANTINNEFVWDDATFISWPLIKSFSNVPKFLRGDLPGSHFGDYRPLKGIILTFDYKLFGENPAGYHVQAILIHLSSVLLVFIVSRKIIDKSAKKLKLAPFLTALIFGIHPVHTEAVTFVTSSSDIIGITFLFASLYFYIKSGESRRNRKLNFAVSAVFAFLAFVSYEITLVLLPILVLYDLCVEMIGIKAIGSRLKSYGVYVLVTVFYGVLRYLVLKVKEDNTYLEGSFFLTFLGTVKGFLVYIWLNVFPQNLTVNHRLGGDMLALTYIDYRREAILAQRITDTSVLLALGVIGLLAVCALVLYKRLPLVTFCILWFFIALLPVANIIPLNNLMSERYVYLSSFGWSLLLGMGVSCIILLKDESFSGKFLKFTLVFFFALYLGFLGARTVLRNGDWQSRESLWAKTLESSPGSVLASHNLGSFYYSKGDFDRSLPLLSFAQENNYKKNSKIPESLAKAYFEKGRNDLAKPLFEEALSYEASLAQSNYYLGLIYLKTGNQDAAKSYLAKSIEYDPTFFDAYIDLGNIFGRNKDYKTALGLYLAAKRVDPKKAISYINISNIYLALKDAEKAKYELDEALKVDPDNEEVKNRLKKFRVEPIGN